MTALTTSLTNLPSVQSVNLSEYGSEMGFLPRIQLAQALTGPVTEGKLTMGNYYSPSSDDIHDFGNTVDILPLAVRHKALDVSGETPVASYDQNDDLFKDIATRSRTPRSGCMYGPSFLVFERDTASFYELFLSNKTGRMEAKKFEPFLPVSEEQAKAFGVKAHGPVPITLRSKTIRSKGNTWAAPVVGKCSTPIDNLPPVEKIVEEITKFMNPKSDDVEVEQEGRSR